MRLVSESTLKSTKSIYAGNGSYTFLADNSNAGWDSIVSLSENDRIIFSEAGSAGLIQFDRYLALITTTDAGVSHSVLLDGLTKNGALINLSSTSLDSIVELNNFFPEKIVQIESSFKDTISFEVPSGFLTGVGAITLGEGNFKISFQDSMYYEAGWKNFNAGDKIILPDNPIGYFNDYNGALRYSASVYNSSGQSAALHFVFNDIATDLAINLIGGSNFAEFNALGFGELV
jgi:hypothetical protein